MNANSNQTVGGCNTKAADRAISGNEWLFGRTDGEDSQGLQKGGLKR